jgi:nitrogenase molybdenum-cofactor synthesis protein NifE
MNPIPPKSTTLSRLYGDSEIPTPYVARYPGRRCAFGPIGGALAYIPNSVVIMVGPGICTFNNFVISPDGRATPGTSYITCRDRRYVTLDREDLTFGTETVIRQAVLKAVEEQTFAVIFIVTSCLPEIIAEDFDGFIRELDGDVTPAVIGIHSENYTEEDPSVGIGLAMAALTKLMQPKGTRPNSYNLLGVRTKGVERSELTQCLHDAGLRPIAHLPRVKFTEELASCGSAAFNLVVEHHALPLAENMREEFGIPYFHLEQSFSPTSIRLDYERLSEFLIHTLGIEITSPPLPVFPDWNRARDYVKDHTAVVTALHGRTLSLVRLLLDLGISVPAIFLKQYDTWDVPDAEALLAAGFDAEIIRGDDRLAIEYYLREHQIDLGFGYLEPESVEYLSSAYLPIRAAGSMVGYSAVASLLEAVSDLGGRASTQEPLGKEIRECVN